MGDCVVGTCPDHDGPVVGAQPIRVRSARAFVSVCHRFPRRDWFGPNVDCRPDRVKYAQARCLIYRLIVEFSSLDTATSNPLLFPRGFHCLSSCRWLNCPSDDCDKRLTAVTFCAYQHGRGGTTKWHAWREIPLTLRRKMFLPSESQANFILPSKPKYNPDAQERKRVVHPRVIPA